MSQTKDCPDGEPHGPHSWDDFYGWEWLCPGVQAEGPLAAFVAEVAAERRRQIAKWGVQRHPDGTGRSGYIRKTEIARITCQVDAAASDGGPRWSLILLEEVYEALSETDPDALRQELVQVAAVCSAWADDLANRKGN